MTKENGSAFGLHFPKAEIPLYGKKKKNNKPIVS